MKKVKMVLYGEPGVGKSTFASKFPKPFFITSDGNYEWLTEFGAKLEDHVQVESWEDAKKAFARDYSEYETIVVDLLEDLFKWCEYEYCIRNKIEHVSDVGYGKGYDATRNEFFVEITKLLAKDKNVILIMHGVSTVVKDRRGIEKTKHIPSPRLPDKVLDMIEGRVRYFLRCYLKDLELEDGTLIKQRLLSLIPKPNEFGICRGVDEATTPHDIPLDFNEFAKALKLDVEVPKKVVETKVATVEEPSVEVTETTEVTDNTASDESEETPRVRRHRRTKAEIEAAKKETEEETVEKVESSEENESEESTTEAVEEPVKETPKETASETHEVSQLDKLAAIRAKLAALKAKN